MSKKIKRVEELAKRADWLLEEAKTEPDANRAMALVYAAGKCAGEAEALLAPSAFDRWFWRRHIVVRLQWFIGILNAFTCVLNLSERNYFFAAFSFVSLLVTARWKLPKEGKEK